MTDIARLTAVNAEIAQTREQLRRHGYGALELRDLLVERDGLELALGKSASPGGRRNLEKVKWI